jgi:hypothetical protein
MLGAPGPRGYIAMGGMFTILKVRDELSGDADPGWYENPPGTEASPASEEELRKDGVVTEDANPKEPPVPAGEVPTAPGHHGGHR